MGVEPSLIRRAAWALAVSFCALGAGCTEGADPGSPDPAAAQAPGSKASAAAWGTIDRVFLISLDTLRADHCGFMGYPKPTTPFLDSLAERGVVFTQHYVHSNNTLISHASILTGLVPMAHGAVDRGTPEGRVALKAGFRTLAEEFKAAGFATASFNTHAVWLGRGFGLDQGFDVVESAWIDGPANSAKFLAWYDGATPARLFAFLHYFDAHSNAQTKDSNLPYRSTPELIEQFAGPAPEGFTGCIRGKPNACASEYLHALSRGEEELPPEHLAYLIGLYDAGIRKLDDDLREMFAELERRRLLERALIVITSDHGEAFMEHGQLLHNTFHDELMHVPLIILPPREAAAPARRVDHVTRGIDLAPTILELAGLERIGQGSSVAGALRGGRTASDEVFFNQSVLRGSDTESRFKFELSNESPSFFDLDADPGEIRNLMGDSAFLASNGERLKSISLRINTLRSKNAKLFSSVPGDDAPAELSAKQIKDLEALGYK